MFDSPIVISFYTENTPYQLEVMGLIKSCIQYEIDYEIVALSSKGSWELNCAMKPFFIQEKLKKLKRPIFWVDADAVFKQCPDFSLMLDFDLALREMKCFSHDIRFKFHAGSLFLNYTSKALAFVENWCAYCQKQLDEKQRVEFLDQISLATLIEKDSEIKIYDLPIAYCKVFDIDSLEITEEEIVIEHYQASRRFRFSDNLKIH